MDPDFQHELDRTLKERAQYFTLRWFSRLFRGALSLADSFWIGLFGPLIVAVPAMVMIAMLSKGVDARAGMPVFAGLTLLLGLYWAAVVRGVLIAARRTPHAGGWRWAAVAIAALLAVLAIGWGITGLF